MAYCGSYHKGIREGKDVGSPTASENNKNKMWQTQLPNTRTDRPEPSPLTVLTTFLYYYIYQGH